MQSSASGRNRAKTPFKNFRGGHFEKEFMENFCEVEDAECFGGFATVQTPETRKAESGYNITTKRAA